SRPAGHGAAMTVAFAADATVAWPERNQRWLVSRFAALRERIAGGDGAGSGEAPADDEEDFAPALQRCAELFGLSRFERDVLLLCAGVALDAGLAAAVARAG